MSTRCTVGVQETIISNMLCYFHLDPLLYFVIFTGTEWNRKCNTQHAAPIHIRRSLCTPPQETRDHGVINLAELSNVVRLHSCTSACNGVNDYLKRLSSIQCGFRWAGWSV